MLINVYPPQGLSVAFRINIIYLGESMGLVIIRVIQKGEVYGFESWC